MKLKNKRTGEIIEVITGDTFEVGGIQIRSLKRNPQIVRRYPSLAELNLEWEDVPEEPKECKYWYIDVDDDDVYQTDDQKWLHDRNRKLIGNYFETKEEAEKAVEKLKALANLRKRGLKFNGWDSADRGLVGEFEIYCDAVNLDGIEQELELVFGREEI